MFDTVGIDWGEVRTGFALGDSSSGLAIHDTIIPTAGIFQRIQHHIDTKHISQVVIGLPLSFHNTDTIVTKRIRECITEIQDTFPQLIVKTVNERGTTQDAKKHIHVGKIDDIAALEILNIYFTYN